MRLGLLISIVLLLSACGGSRRPDVVVVAKEPTCSAPSSVACPGCSISCKQGERAVCTTGQDMAHESGAPPRCQQDASCLCMH
jgi:hypothetical protein